jgi:NADH-quinone oxidoreductase subunit N
VNIQDLVTLLPLILPSVAALAILCVISFRRVHEWALGLTLLGLGLSFVSAWIVQPLTPRRIPPLVVMDAYSLFYIGLLAAASFAIALLSFGYLALRQGNREEYYVLLLLATVGAMTLAISNHFATLFLGLELLSVSLYAMIGYLRADVRPLEAAVKYLILAAASSAFLLFGIALIYADRGTLQFDVFAWQGWEEGSVWNPYVLMGLGLVVTGIGFKLAVVPFHLWTPDVYEGAPAPVTAFIATVSKGGVFALLLRFFLSSGGNTYEPILTVFVVIAAASMIFGNFLALLQDNVKRILAYSSIAHLGYLLVAFLAGGQMGIESATFYLVAYFVTILGAFGVISVLAERNRERDLLEDYRGLYWSRPWLAGAFTAMLLSLAGIPLTAGFPGKVLVLASGVENELWFLVMILIVTSAVGLYYYLRVVVTMFLSARENPPVPAPAKVPLPVSGGAVLGVLSVVLLGLGVYPTPLLHLIQTIAAAMW